ncbi:MAG: GNAT family N-acetyltransferase [Alphaproteobacteria bacterium]|nr:GNAT family N-acetyltransferase [Alphaproteobacteria bacterium]
MLDERASRMILRAARTDEAATLTALCMRSKRHWGYDDAFMRRCAITLAVPGQAIARGDVQVAVDEDGQPLGTAQLSPPFDDAIELDKLFVDPPAIGHGVGAALLRWAMDETRARGAKRLVILADPHAATFYEKMGARFLHMAPSDAVPGRQLPFYEVDLRGPQS